MKHRMFAFLALGLALQVSHSLAAGGGHEHGAVRLDVAIEGNRLSIAMHAPLDNLLGYERAPRTDNERKAANELLARLRNPGQGKPLFSADAAAHCVLGKTEVTAPVLESAGKSPAAQGKDSELHADVEATYEYTCSKPAELRTLEVALLEAYRRIHRVDVQVAGPQGQSKVTLKRPSRTVKLAR